MADTNNQFSKPKLLSCRATLIQAFPTTPSVYREGFYWNGTPWLNDSVFGLPTLNKIKDYASILMPNVPRRKLCPAIVDFGSPPPANRNIPREDTLFVIFPHIKEGSIAQKGSCKTLMKWTDELVIPAMCRNIDPSRIKYLTPSHNLIVMNSQVERIELSRKAPDDPYDYFVPQEYMGDIWDDIVATTKKTGFEEFRDVFLMIISEPPLGRTVSRSFEETWAKTMKIWNEAVDMQYVSEEGLDIRIESQITFMGEESTATSTGENRKGSDDIDRDESHKRGCQGIHYEGNGTECK